MPAILRAQLISFDPADWTAVVLLAGSVAEVVMPVGEWVAGGQLAADDDVAVLLFDDTNPDNGLVLGPFGGVAGNFNLPPITGQPPTNGQVPIGRTSDGALVLAVPAGTANQVIVTPGAGTLTLSAPQDLHSGASPTFIPIAARVYNSGALTITTATTTTLTFDSERFDLGGLHSTSSNTARLTAPVDGVYAIFGHIRWDNNATGVRELIVRLNGATIIAAEKDDAAGEAMGQSLATLYQLAAGDYVELRARQTSGGNLNVTATGNYSPEFGMHRVL
jgi:hypothetical protein